MKFKIWAILSILTAIIGIATAARAEVNVDSIDVSSLPPVTALQGVQVTVYPNYPYGTAVNIVICRDSLGTGCKNDMQNDLKKEPHALPVTDSKIRAKAMDTVYPGTFLSSR